MKTKIIILSGLVFAASLTGAYAQGVYQTSGKVGVSEYQTQTVAFKSGSFGKKSFSKKSFSKKSFSKKGFSKKSYGKKDYKKKSYSKKYY